MESKEQEELLEELLYIETIVKENPCKMPAGLIGALREVMHSFIGKSCIDAASRDQVAIYLKRDVRTLTRWQQQYDDFPKPRHEGHREVCYNWMEIVRWKLKHKELYPS